MKKWFLTVLLFGIVAGIWSNQTLNQVCLVLAAFSLIGFPPGMILAFSVISVRDDVYDIQHGTGYGSVCLIPAIFKSVPTFAWVVVVTRLIIYGLNCAGR
jgi:hypothetical protein